MSGLRPRIVSFGWCWRPCFPCHHSVPSSSSVPILICQEILFSFATLALLWSYLIPCQILVFLLLLVRVVSSPSWSSPSGWCDVRMKSREWTKPKPDLGSRFNFLEMHSISPPPSYHLNHHQNPHLAHQIHQQRWYSPDSSQADDADSLTAGYEMSLSYTRFSPSWAAIMPSRQ